MAKSKDKRGRESRKAPAESLPIRTRGELTRVRRVLADSDEKRAAFLATLDPRQREDLEPTTIEVPHDL
jgi:hypothetical protein